MKTDQELFSLRDNYLEFKNPLALRESIIDFLDDDLNFPLIAGHIWSDKKDYGGWQTQYIGPRNTGDELTIKNYLQGLYAISNLNEGALKNFEGEIILGGVESKNSEYRNSRIFTSWFNNLNEHYFLRLNFSEYENNDVSTIYKLAYSACAGESTSPINKMMTNYLGPHKKTE